MVAAVVVSFHPAGCIFILMHSLQMVQHGCCLVAAVRAQSTGLGSSLQRLQETASRLPFHHRTRHSTVPDNFSAWFYRCC